MEIVQNGSFVRVEYTGTLANGEVFYSSEGRQPLEVQVGAGHVIPGFEAALMGMAPGEMKTVTLEPEDAYGPRDDGRIQTVAVADLPPGKWPEAGQNIRLTTTHGHQVTAKVASIDDTHVTFDLNHPFAGEHLTFTLRVAGISSSPTLDTGGCMMECSGCASGNSCLH